MTRYRQRCRICGRFGYELKHNHSDAEYYEHAVKQAEKDNDEMQEHYYSAAVKAGQVCEYCDAIGCSPERHERGY